MQKFDKKAFIAEVKDNVKKLYRKNIEEADKQQIFQAVSYAVKDSIIDNWMMTQKEYEKQDPKIRLLHVHGVPDGSCHGKQPDQPDRV